MTPEFSGMESFSPQQPWKNTFFDPKSGFLFIEPRNLEDEMVALANIYADSFNGPPWFEEWSLDSAVSELRQSVDKGADFIVGLDREASPVGFGVGYAITKYSGRDFLLDLGFVNSNNIKGTYYIAELCTAPKARGLGICSQVVRGLIESAQGQGYNEVLTRTRADNENMLRIFKRAGFSEVGRYEAETGGICSERVVLRVNLVNLSRE
jgi:ribosomal protein S18 acetylase RimI-like enzyme